LSLDAFIEKFNGMTEPYFFYDGTIELQYEPKDHVYYRIIDGEFVAQDGVTTVVHIIDKSDALIPWGCKMMAAKLLSTAPTMTLPTGEKVIPQASYEDFEKLVLASKNAHKEKLDEAASVGHEAHAWIERYIKAVLATGPASLQTQEILANLPEEPRANNCCQAALRWMRAHNVRWRCTERKIYSREFEYAGTMDGLALVDSCGDSLCCPFSFKDRLSVIDWKTSNYLYLEYLLQTAAYQYAYIEETKEAVEDRWIIRLGKDDGEFDPWHVERGAFNEDFTGFLFALRLGRKIRAIKERMKAQTDRVKAEKKARSQAEKEAALKVKCKGADRYKGIRPPKCNNGNPCQNCRDKYAYVQREDALRTYDGALITSVEVSDSGR
jgi:hypothetical protein